MVNDCDEPTLTIKEAHSSVSSSDRVSLPACDICHEGQKELGALRFGPPRKFEGVDGQWCRKLHVCVKCEKAS